MLADANAFKDFFEKYEEKKFSHDMEVVVIDYADLFDWNNRVAQEVLEKPDLYLKELKKSTLNFFSEEIEVLIKNIPKHIQLQDLRTKHLGKMILVNGIVCKTIPPRPMIVSAAFECRKCGTKRTIIQNEPFLVTPNRCGVKRKGCKSIRFRLLEDPTFTTYSDVQDLSIQEKPEDLKVGQAPKIVNLEVTKPSLINMIQAGDIVDIIGILRTKPPSATTKKRKWVQFIDVIYSEKQNSDPSSIEISPEEEQKIQWLASDKDIYNKIIASIAPSIYGYENIKESIMYQLFGGCEKQYHDRVSRGNIHILWIDDPSTAKSQVLLATKNMASRGIYVSGGGASGAGLTAAVIKVDGGEMFALEAGAMVLANGGICCIDEIEKMKPEDRKRIHEAMAQQMVSIQKANVHYTLPAKTAILAAGNPAFGRYDCRQSVSENISLPSSILSRFDLIFIGRGDRPNVERDEGIVTHVLENPDLFRAEISNDLLKKYIAYAKRIKPKLTKKAIERIKKFYLKMRNLYEGDKEKSPIVITARQLEGLRRLSEAHARVRLSNKVEDQDAIAAINIMCKSLEQAGVDPITGKHDIDAMSGTPQVLRDKINIILHMFDGGELVSRKEIFERMEQSLISRDETSKILTKLLSKSTIYEPKESGYYKRIPR